MNKKIVSLFALTTAAALGTWLFVAAEYTLLSMLLAVTVCVFGFVSFENDGTGGRELALIAVFTALTAVGRIVFAPLPAFKPVTALTVIAGIAFGARAGFITGSMAALLSNIYFGQGPWTPFQMAAWGIIGLFAGLIFSKKKTNMALLLVYGAFAGVIFSLVMDIWTVLSVENGFSLERYMFYVGTSLPVMAVYVVSNVIFLAVLAKPLIAKTNRICLKYGAFNGNKRTENRTRT